jgi:hypothetical protein
MDLLELLGLPILVLKLEMSFVPKEADSFEVVGLEVMVLELVLKVLELIVAQEP